MRSAFWNNTTAEALPSVHFTAGPSTFVLTLWVPAGVMWQSEAPLNPDRHPQRLATITPTPPFSFKKTRPRAKSPGFWL